MDRSRGFNPIRVALVIVVAVTVMLVTAGCGLIGEHPVQQWQTLASGHISGNKPVTLPLGIYTLGDRVRLRVVLSGPHNPRVTLTLHAQGLTNGEGYGNSAPLRKDPEGGRLGLGFVEVTPGAYRVSFSQRFRKADGPGYDIDYTLSTLHSLRNGE